jgi:hypothetical protein
MNTHSRTCTIVTKVNMLYSSLPVLDERPRSLPERLGP